MIACFDGGDAKPIIISPFSDITKDQRHLTVICNLFLVDT